MSTRNRVEMGLLEECGDDLRTRNQRGTNGFHNCLPTLLSSRAKRGILVLACGEYAAMLGRNQDPSLRSGRQLWRVYGS